MNLKVQNFASENELILIEDCAHVLKADLSNGKSDIFNAKYSILSFSKFIDCSPLGGLWSPDKEFLRFVDNEINQSNKFQSIIFNFLIKICNLIGSDKLLYKKLYSVNYSLWNFLQNLNSKIHCFKKIQNEIKLDKRFSLLKGK